MLASQVSFVNRLWVTYHGYQDKCIIFTKATRYLESRIDAKRNNDEDEGIEDYVYNDYPWATLDRVNIIWRWPCFNYAWRDIHVDVLEKSVVRPNVGQLRRRYCLFSSKMPRRRIKQGSIVEEMTLGYVCGNQYAVAQPSLSKEW